MKNTMTLPIMQKWYMYHPKETEDMQLCTDDSTLLCIIYILFI
jgi:hypothetical protein